MWDLGMEGTGRRQFLRLAQAGLVALPLVGRGQEAAVPALTAQSTGPRLKVGLIGCGGRGSWISGLFREHGGYEFGAVADLFEDRARKTGETLGVVPARCFWGVDGYRQVLAAGVDAVILQTPPCFFPRHAAAAVEAGCHVYLAKPVAVDVSGVEAIRRLAVTAAGQGLVILPDYQMPVDPVNQAVAERIRGGGLGRLQTVFSSGWAGGNGYQDPPRDAAPEQRLKDLVWCNDIALGGDYIVHYDVHILDAVVWALGRMPVAAMGVSDAFRPSVVGDARDSVTVVYLFEDGLTWCHQGMLGAYHDWIKAGRLTASIQGAQGTACLSYAGKSYVRGGPRHFSGGVPNPEASVRRNIDDFRTAVTQRVGGNGHLQRALDSTLTAILGREAAARRGMLTLEQLKVEAVVRSCPWPT